MAELNDKTLNVTRQDSVNSGKGNSVGINETTDGMKLIYDIKWSGTDDKFASAILHASYRNNKPDFDSMAWASGLSIWVHSIARTINAHVCNYCSIVLISPSFKFTTLLEAQINQISCRPVYLSVLS